MTELTPNQKMLFRLMLVVALPFLMVWGVAYAFVKETRSAWWFIFHEPLLVWEEWIDAYRKGPP